MPMQYVCIAICMKVMHSVILVMDRQILIDVKYSRSRFH